METISLEENHLVESVCDLSPTRASLPVIINLQSVISYKLYWDLEPWHLGGWEPPLMAWGGDIKVYDMYTLSI